ncbi:hypothetical protein BJ912DRAFT_1139989 [Pholiota molesta]|nr:hypothetical protein BJ912DRAFT_1139989 [Pholiota molesta]
MIDGSESFKPAAGARSKRVDAECQVDDTYYFENVIFKVDNTLFRVPKHCFDVEGTPFPALFSDVSSRTPEGDYQEPIVLDGVSKAQFKVFLSVIYPPTKELLTCETLVMSLDLAATWGFSQLRTHIIRELGYSIKERPLHEAIILARICKKEQWLIDAYVTLIAAKDPLDLVNLVQKGIDNDTIAKLFRSREEMIRTNEFDKKSEAVRIVKGQFTAELEGMLSKEERDLKLARRLKLFVAFA